MDLGGLWRVAAGTESRRRNFHEFDYDDSNWATMPVPSHWAQQTQHSLHSRYSQHDRHTQHSRYSQHDRHTQHSRYSQHDLHARQIQHTQHTQHAQHADSSGENLAEDLANKESVLYRHWFNSPDKATETDRRWWLRLEGIAQQGDIWFDGTYLGHTDGYFVPHELEVTSHLKARGEHLLAIDAMCRRFGDPDNRSTLTGALQDPELCGTGDLIVGGVWRPVWLRSSGTVAIRHARVVCDDVRNRDGRSRRGRAAHVMGARLKLRTVIDVPGGGEVSLRTRVAGTEHVHTHQAAVGENRIEWNVEVVDPPLWWPRALGEQSLCDLTLDVISAGEVHDRRRFRTGFRSLAMHRWVLHVNGERIFLKGANLLPTKRLPGTASPSEVAADVRAACDGGLDMLRVQAHIARPEVYEAADELGILIWQDLPVRGLMSRGVAAEARRQAREAVDLLAHHPSLAVWCAHDEPFAHAQRQRPSPRPPALRHLGPSWNRDVLDRRLSRVLSRCDGSRPVIAHTGVPPHLQSLEGTTSQLWYGCHGGRAADLAQVLARLPALARFVSGFGTSVVEEQPEVIKTTIEILRRLKYRPTGGFLLHALADPGLDPRTPTTEIDDTDLLTLGTEEGDSGPLTSASKEGDTGSLTPTTEAGTPDTLTPATEEGDAGSPTTEEGDAGSPTTAEGNAGSPTTEKGDAGSPTTEKGNAGSPTTEEGDAGSSTPITEGFGVLDGLRRPKPGWQALVDACRPLAVMADPLPLSVQAGERIRVAVHVVNDTRQDVDSMEVTALLTGPSGSVVSAQRWQGSAPADSCVLVGRIKAEVPPEETGTLTLELTLTPTTQPTAATPHRPKISNHYHTTITPP